jgi:hypothetical protein
MSRHYRPGEFSLVYYRLAKGYHPDRADQTSHDLMASMNAAPTTILKTHRDSE